MKEPRERERERKREREKQKTCLLKGHPTFQQQSFEFITMIVFMKQKYMPLSFKKQEYRNGFTLLILVREKVGREPGEKLKKKECSLKSW